MELEREDSVDILGTRTLNMRILNKLYLPLPRNTLQSDIEYVKLHDGFVRLRRFVP